MTTLMHGAAETERVKAAAAALFGGGDLHRARRARRSTRRSREAPHVDVAGPASCRRIVDLLAETGLVDEQGRCAAHGRRGRCVRSTTCGSPTRRARRPPTTCSPGGWLLLRRGKRNLAGVEVG